jgi:SAM-dependent methyltransferase
MQVRPGDGSRELGGECGGAVDEHPDIAAGPRHGADHDPRQPRRSGGSIAAARQGLDARLKTDAIQLIPTTVPVVEYTPKDIVEAGYDRVAERHLAWINEIRGDPRLRFLHKLMARLPVRPKVLDLGCGAGIPCTALLAARGDVIGVDLSASQIEMASKKVPNAQFIKADMSALELPPASFDAVTAFYVGSRWKWWHGWP